MTPHTGPRRSAGPAILGQNQYGKAETRVVRITRDGATHHIRDLNVSVTLSGDMDEVHYSGSNTNVLPTDTMKNTVFAFAKRYGIESPEQFGIHLARHFVTGRGPIRTARIRIEEYAWERITASDTAAADAGPRSVGTDEPPGHSFVGKGQATRLAQITYDGSSWEIVSGVKDLVVMNSTHSEFWGFARDEYTTLQETHDRILATEVSGRWRFGWTDDGQPMPDWEESAAQTGKHLLQAFAETYSRSLQQTLYQMGSRIIEHRDEIDEVRFSLPNKHHFPVDLEPFGLENDNEVYYAADRPYGLIEATVLRHGCEPRIPVDLTDP